MSKLNWWKTAGAVCGLCAIAAIAARAQTFTTLVKFEGINGAEPLSALVQGTDGNLYGTTIYGGIYDYGTVFKMTLAGDLTTLYSFCAETSCLDGSYPSGLALGSDGNFYGTTFSGGYTDSGTVFKITPAGALTTIYGFCSGSCLDGAYPAAGLVQGADGDFYGTTTASGSYDYGAVFKITPSGTLTTLAEFDFTDGRYPEAALIQAANGSLYGTTSLGGVSDAGIVFKMTSGGTLTTLYSFDGYLADGADPYSSLVQGADGDFFGTTVQGGAVRYNCTYGCGTVFKITPAGKLTTLHSFGVAKDGQYPYAAVVQASDGAFYGTASGGGENTFGTVFKITLAGKEFSLHSFHGVDDGDSPKGALLQATNGSFYGTTAAGGAVGNYGTIFSLALGLQSFIATVPTARQVGQKVMILGTNLTGTTSVTFNGTAATFTVASPSLITATVPAGATSGAVHVATPAGTLSSNSAFRVLP